MRLMALLLVLVLTWPVAARDAETVSVTAVIDGDTLTIEPPVSGARQVRLVGIEAPRLALGRPDFATWPLADAAREVLETLALGRRVHLTRGEHGQDRHGRLLAHVHREDGAWLQAEILRRGFARVRGFPDNRAHLDELLLIEAAARAGGIGIWSHPFYAVRTPTTVAHDIDSFQIVEGRIVEARRGKQHVYLNYGADWRTDFTVAIATTRLRSFEAAGLDPLALAGRVVRVRGWVTSFNGPLIDATHPEQIELIDEAALGHGDRPHSPCCSNNPRTRAAWTIAR